MEVFRKTALCVILLELSCSSLQVVHLKELESRQITADKCSLPSETNSVSSYQPCPFIVSTSSCSGNSIFLRRQIPPTRCQVLYQRNIKLIRILCNKRIHKTPFKVLKNKLHRMNIVCRTKYLMRGMKGSHLNNDYLSRTTKKDAISGSETKQLMIPRSASADSLIKLGVITAVVSVMFVLCMVLSIAFHICSNRITCGIVPKDSHAGKRILDAETETHLLAGNNKRV